MGSGGWGYTHITSKSSSRNDIGLKSVMDISCAMMTINIVIDSVKWLICNLQTSDKFLNMSSKNENDVINQIFYQDK